MNDEIIKILQTDPATSNKEIGERLNISEVTVASRIRAMEEDNILRVIMQRDLQSYGFNASALLAIGVHGRPVEEVAETLAEIDECISVSICLTAPDILVQLAALNDRDVQQIVENRISTIPGIAQCEVTINLQIIKIDNRYGSVDVS
ncbi:Lrp/AsnC family transcriptional regulator [Novosphingobium sp. HII-3]|uniref:Lrp/AsnC family transcriptional regulator n=1 Tax=Novosphingobium sp. HII-3 TaxID=2075565 RepID=UPI001304E044|nr:Lrp/AsnC family transcriptional regulator [Novosphingobium sp. HII-3]